MRVLREVAERGSFSAAAEALNFTQSAISQQIAALERECGSSLVERGPRGIRLTDAGRALVSHADAILARIDDAEAELAAIAGLRGGRLRIASFQSAGATLVPRAMAEFHRRHPEVELNVRQAEQDAAQDLLRAGDVDIAIVMDFADQPILGRDFDLTHLLDDPYCVILPADHPLARRRSLEIADLADERWIVPEPGSGCREGVVRACRLAGFEPRLAIESDENEQVQAFVAGGLGIGLWPRLALTHVRPGVAVKPLARGGMERAVYAATVADGYRSPAALAMIEILRDAAAEFTPPSLKAA
jgi:DNA-binding transcriptional LysR family regulator